MVYNIQQYGQNPNHQRPNYQQQPNQYRQPQYGSPRPMGPPIGQMFHQSPLAKIGLVIIILAIVGLIISFAVPWGFYDSDAYEEKFFGHDFKNSDDDELFNEDTSPYHHGIPGMADLGLIFLLIIGILAMILGFVSFSYRRGGKWFSFMGLVVALVALFPSLLVMIAGLRCVGFNIFSALNEADPMVIFPAGYILLIFGVIFFILVLKLIKDEIASLGIKTGPSFVNNPQMYFFKEEDKK